MIPYGKQSIEQDDIKAVIDALQSDYLTTGPKVGEFEEAFAKYCGVKHAVSCSNGTAALHLAMLAAEIGAGEKVVTSPNTFLASANAGKFVSADVEFCDIEPVSATMNFEILSEEWKPETKAVVAVDYAGHPADHERIGNLVHERGAILIEDACHAVGGEFEAKDGSRYKIGGLPWVDMATFSFHPVKTMTTGEGGMITTNRDDLAEKLRSFRNHGMTRDPEKFEFFGRSGLLKEAGSWAYEMERLGFNYRLTDLQCALGLSQLRKLDSFVQRRAEIVAAYNECFSTLPFVTLPAVAEWHSDKLTNSWHLYVLRIDFSGAGWTRSGFIDALSDNGVGAQVHYIPVHLQPFYREVEGTKKAGLGEVESFYQQCISLPLWPGMGDEEVSVVCDVVTSLIDR